MKKQIKKISSLLLVFAIMLTTFCFAPLTAQAETIDLYCLQLPRASDSNQNNWGHKAIDFMGGWTNKANDIWLAYAVGSYNGKASYCIEPGIGVASGDTLTKKDESYWENYPSKYNKTIKPEVIRSIIGRILQYGYTGNLSTSWNSKTDADDISNYLATQLLIWETVVGERDGNFKHVDATASGYDNVFSMIYKSHPLYDEIKSNYDRIVNSVKNHTVKPSFMAGSSSAATTYDMAWDGSKYTVTLTDTNNVLSNFNFSSNDSAMKFSVSGNKLTISTTKVPTSTLAITATSKHYRKGVVTWSDGEISPGSNGIQDVVTYGASVTDPTYAYFKLKSSVGNLKLVKKAEDNNVSGLKFRVKQDSISYDETFTTNADGVINANNLIAGLKYTITEVNTSDKYVVPNNQTVIIETGKTSTVTFSNTLKKFSVSVKKIDIETTTPQGNATLIGAVYGIYDNGTLVDEYTTDVNGSFTTNNYICGDNWTLKEITPSEGYTLDTKTYHIGAEAKNYSVEINKTSNEVKEQVINGNVSIIKHTDDGSTKIETPEKGAEFQIYLKSAGSFAQAKETEKDTIICDEDGFASSKLLPYGIYTVHQSKGWDGREKIKDFDVYIKFDGKTYKYLINNANYSSYLKVVKTDAETGKSISYAGAGFEIYDTDGHRVSMQYTYPEVTTIHTFYTNNEGYLITPEKLPYGDYTLVEVEAPYGYIIDKTEVPFSITQDNESTDTGVSVVMVKAKDTPQKGIIEITKTGEVFSTVTNSDNVYQPKYEMANLKDATYEIYADEDITTLDGTIRYEKGTLVDTITTDEDGIAKTKELYLGKYKIVEKVAPYGYVLDTKEYQVELTYAGQDIKVTSTSFSAYDEKQKVSISLSKMVEEDKTFSIGNNGEIKNVSFALYANEDITALDGSIIPKGSIIAIKNCDEKGKLTFDSDLPFGSYYVKEYSADNHYIMTDTKFEFTFDYTNQSEEETVIVLNDGKPIGNKIARGKLVICKTDISTGKPIANCCFEILDKNKKVLIKGKTNDKGILEFQLPVGDYYYKEYSCKGYELDETEYAFSIKENGQIVKANMTNKPIVEKITKFESPKTGNEKNNGLWFGMGAILVGGVISAIILKIKLKKDEYDE